MTTNTFLANINIEPESITIAEAAEIVWDWRKYRNRVFWNTVYRYGAACVVLTMLPYVLSDLPRKLGRAILVFPVMVSFLSFLAAYLVAYQYMLYKQVTAKQKCLLGKYCPEDIPNTSLLNRAFRISIGKIMAVVFLLYGVVVQPINGAVLLAMIHGTIP